MIAEAIQLSPALRFRPFLPPTSGRGLKSRPPTGRRRAPGAVMGAQANVQDILARARSAPAAGPVRTGSGAVASLDPVPPRGGPFVPIPDETAVETSPRPAPAPATGIAAASKVAPATQLLPIPRAPATQKKPLDPGLKLTFTPGSKTLSTSEQSRLILAVAQAGLARGAQVTLMLGPASSDSSFERLSLAQRRGEAVATMLPQGLEIVQNYRPELPPDAVWVVFGGRYAPEVVSQ
jgi:hypothetical protein